MPDILALFILDEIKKPPAGDGNTIIQYIFAIPYNDEIKKPPAGDGNFHKLLLPFLNHHIDEIKKPPAGDGNETI